MQTDLMTGTTARSYHQIIKKNNSRRGGIRYLGSRDSEVQFQRNVHSSRARKIDSDFYIYEEELKT